MEKTKINPPIGVQETNNLEKLTTKLLKNEEIKKSSYIGVEEVLDLKVPTCPKKMHDEVSGGLNFCCAAHARDRGNWP